MKEDSIRQGRKSSAVTRRHTADYLLPYTRPKSSGSHQEMKQERSHSIQCEGMVIKVANKVIM